MPSLLGASRSDPFLMKDRVCAFAASRKEIMSPGLRVVAMLRIYLKPLIGRFLCPEGMLLGVPDEQYSHKRSALSRYVGLCV